MATLAHPTANDIGRPRDASAIRAALERAVDAAPSHVRPPRGRLRRLFARDRSARALVERYRLWPAIEHAWTRVSREYGPVRAGVAVEENEDETYVSLEIFCDAPSNDELYEFESAVKRESRDLLDDRRWRKFRLFINPPFPRSSGHEV